ncbi:hypothetical protein J6A31_03560 [bacterium]|nr:hypothetical protein [bacterium]
MIQIQPPYNNIYIQQVNQTQYQPIQMPTGQRNYVIVDKNKVDYFVKRKEQALPQLSNILSNSNNESEITESLYIVDRLIDNGTKGVDKMYPVLSRFNNTNSPNIQTFLAGIYRKTQIPDAFGPLVAMLFRNSMNPPRTNFDPNEEVGGAILAYISDRFRNNP